MDIAGVVVALETDVSVVDLLVAEFSPKPIATAASPAVTHMKLVTVAPSKTAW